MRKLLFLFLLVLCTPFSAGFTSDILHSYYHNITNSTATFDNTGTIYLNIDVSNTSFSDGYDDNGMYLESTWAASRPVFNTTITNFTIASWVRVNATENGYEGIAMIQDKISGSGGGSGAVYARLSSLVPQCIVVDTAGSSEIGSYGSTAIDLNSWTHIACVYHPNGTINTYINGTLDKSTHTSWDGSKTFNQVYIELGRINDWAGSNSINGRDLARLNGTLDNTLFINHSLTTEEVLSLVSGTPAISQVFINTTPYDVNDDLEGYCQVGGHTENVTFRWSWYKNGEYYPTGQICASDINVCADGFVASRMGAYCTMQQCPTTPATIMNPENISSSDLSVGDSWVLECTAEDSLSVQGEPVNSTAVTITQTVNFSFYDDVTQDLITEDISFDLISDSVSQSFTVQNGSQEVTFNTSETYELRFDSSSYELTLYEFTPSSSVDALNLTMVNTSAAVDVTIIVTDELGNFVEGAKIEVQKQNVADNNFVLNQVLTTNFEGEAVGNFIQNDPFYKFIIKVGGETVFTSTSTQIYGTSLSFTVVLETFSLDQIFDELDISGTVSKVDNNTYRFIYSGTNVTQGCLEAYRFRRTTELLYNSSCASTTSGTLFVDIDNTTGYRYVIKGFATVGGIKSLIDSAYADFVEETNYTNIGNFFMGFIIVLGALLTRTNLSVSVIVSGTILLLFSLLGITTIGLPISIPIFLLSLVIAYLLRVKR